ncbi:hypothetical protein Syun_011252 [Stephania yunnanensis]|uniref:Uncharacterized protein n=1 Tax=Stephania yunnanensis TaxID=152371 RepID=A0AAP0JX80_9MAGN
MPNGVLTITLSSKWDLNCVWVAVLDKSQLRNFLSKLLSWQLCKSRELHEFGSGLGLSEVTFSLCVIYTFARDVQSLKFGGI